MPSAASSNRGGDDEDIKLIEDNQRPSNEVRLVQEEIERQKTPINFIGHIWMVLLLVLIVMIYIKSVFLA